MLEAGTTTVDISSVDKQIVMRLKAKRTHYKTTLKKHSSDLSQNITNIICAKIDSLNEHIQSYDLAFNERNIFLSKKHEHRKNYLNELLQKRNNGYQANEAYMAYNVYCKHVVQIEHWITQIKEGK